MYVTDGGYLTSMWRRRAPATFLRSSIDDADNPEANWIAADVIVLSAGYDQQQTRMTCDFCSRKQRFVKKNFLWLKLNNGLILNSP